MERKPSCPCWESHHGSSIIYPITQSVCRQTYLGCRTASIHLVVPVTRTLAVRDSSLHLYSHNVHHGVNNSPPMKSILGLTITCNMLPNNCSKINLIISRNICFNHHSGLLPSDFPAKTLHIISASPFIPHAQTIIYSLIL